MINPSIKIVVDYYSVDRLIVAALFHLHTLFLLSWNRKWQVKTFKMSHLDVSAWITALEISLDNEKQNLERISK